jgi:hypothetical protein
MNWLAERGLPFARKTPIFQPNYARKVTFFFAL